MTSPRVTRARWGARPVPVDRPTRVPSTEGTAVHWVGPGMWGARGPAGRHAECPGKLRGIQRSHMAGEWYDIAYNEAVCPHGYRFELRGHHVQTGANGSSAGNRSHYAILALVGVGDPTTPELLAALQDAFEDYRRNADAGPDTTTHAVLLRRHTGKLTACPGPTLTATEAGGAFTRPLREDDDMPSAEEIATETWTRPVRDLAGTEYTTGQALGITFRNSTTAVELIRAMSSRMDPAALADALGASLAPLLAAELDAHPAVTREDLEAALRAVLGSVDEVPA